MAIRIIPVEDTEFTKIICPECGERVRGVGLRKGSAVKGLTLQCKRCRHTFLVETT